MRRFPAILSIVAGIVACCSVGILGGTQPAVRLFDLTTARGIADDLPLHPTRVFAADDEVVYLWYAADGCGVGTTITSTWLYLETDPPFRLGEGRVTVTRSDNWGQFNFALAPGRRWAIGRYRIELRIGDTLMAETTFDVSARATVARFQTPSSAR